jgi:hypothetical protein
MSNEAIIHRIRSLLAKTIENGCTEAEAMMAASKAAEMMDEHDIRTIDLSEKSVFVELIRSGVRHDILKRNLGIAVAKYCGCYMILSGMDMKLMGRDMDIVMAEWLYDTLVAYCARGLKDHMSGKHLLPSNQKTMLKNGFILGAVRRISERLEEMMKVRVVQSNALVLSRVSEAKEAAIAKIEANGGKLKDARKARSIYAGQSSMDAGRAHGDRANLSRPISGNGNKTMIR